MQYACICLSFAAYTDVLSVCVLMVFVYANDSKFLCSTAVLDLGCASVTGYQPWLGMVRGVISQL